MCALSGANTCGGQLHADRAVGERGVFLLPTTETRLLVVETWELRLFRAVTSPR